MAEFGLPRLIENPFPFVQAPTRLTSVFPVVQSDPHDTATGVTFEVDGCSDEYVEVDYDNYDDCIRTAAKVFPEGFLYADSFQAGTLLSALKCRPGAIGGGSLEEFEARAERRLHRVESAFLEDKLEEWVIANGTAEATSANWDQAIGKLLKRTAVINQPVLHLPIDIAYAQGSNLDNLALLGVGLVASPKYTIAFITGAIGIWGSEISTHAVPSLEDNYTLAMAERQYSMAVECEPYTAALT